MRRISWILTFKNYPQMKLDFPSNTNPRNVVCAETLVELIISTAALREGVGVAFVNYIYSELRNMMRAD